MTSQRTQGNFRRPLRCAVLAGLLGTVIACSAPARLEAVTVLQHGQCQRLSAGVHLTTYAELAQLRGSNLLSITGGDEAAPGRRGDDPDPLLIAVSRGTQRTAGYSLALESATLRQGEALLTVRWQTPAEGTMQAQVLTHPCLVVALPRAPVERVRVVDQSGTVLGELTVAAASVEATRPGP